MLDLAAARRAAEAPQLAGPADRPAVVADLAAAFVDDPMLGWFIREQGRERALVRFFDVMLRLYTPASARVLRPATGGAAAVWLDSETMAQASGWLRDLQAGAPLLASTGLAGFGRMVGMRAAMDRHHPHAPHAYLWFLGVTPAVQGAGIGSRLLRSELDRLDREGRAAFLETATGRNVALYVRHGFRVIDTYRPKPDEGPLVRAMWRAPGSGDQLGEG